MSLIGDGIGHAAFAGVAAGYLLGISPVGAALVASVLAAIGIEWLRARHGTAGDQQCHRQRGRRQRRNEFLRRFGEDATHGEPTLLQSTDEIECLIRGDAAADDE